MADVDRPPVPKKPTLRPATTVLAGVLALVLLLGALVGLGATGRLPVGPGSGDRPPTRSPAPSPTRPVAPAVLAPAPAGSGSATPAQPVLQVARLSRLLRDPALGAGAAAAVLDAATGAVLLDRDARVPHAPASTAKLATAAAALVTLGPGRRLTTRVVPGARPGEVVLVGAGDATLTAARPRPTDLPRRASLAVLADRVAAVLRRSPPVSVTVSVDDSLFAGPAVSPDWPAGYVASGVVGPVQALSVDGGRVRPGGDAREHDPAIAAGQRLARLLSARGLEVRDVVRRTTTVAGARALAQVRSPTIAQLVEADLTTSDNDLAEALLRLVAVERRRPGSFVAGAATMTDVLGAAGVPTEGLELRDGSGLARTSRVTPLSLARLLTAASAAGHPRLRPIVTGLPVAGFSGTLADRYTGSPAGAAAGRLRAKTGTLTGVSTLAGLTVRAGHPLVLVLMAGRVPTGGTLAARRALDRWAALVTGTA